MRRLIGSILVCLLAVTWQLAAQHPFALYKDGSPRGWLVSDLSSAKYYASSKLALAKPKAQDPSQAVNLAVLKGVPNYLKGASLQRFRLLLQPLKTGEVNQDMLIEDLGAYASATYGLHLQALAGAVQFQPQSYSWANLMPWVDTLMAFQQPDGYIGIMPKNRRGQQGDCFAMQYYLNGLLACISVAPESTYRRMMIKSAYRMADYILANYNPAKVQLNTVDGGDGLEAAGLILPMAMLYTITNQPDYLRFGKQVAIQMNERSGAFLLTHLLKGRPVYALAQGQAATILNVLQGMLALYQISNDERLLLAVENAWLDIHKNRQFINGGVGSQGKFVKGLPKSDGPTNTCAAPFESSLWAQLSHSMYLLTGDPIYAEAFVFTLNNSLLPAWQEESGLAASSVPAIGTLSFARQLHMSQSALAAFMAWLPSMLLVENANSLTLLSGVSGNINIGPKAKPAITTTNNNLGQQLTISVVNDTMLDSVLGKGKDQNLQVLVPHWAGPMTLGRDTAKPRSHVKLSLRANAGKRIALNFGFRTQIVNGYQFGHARHTAVLWGPWLTTLLRKDMPLALQLAGDMSYMPNLNLDQEATLKSAAKGQLYFKLGAKALKLPWVSSWSASRLTGQDFTQWLPVFGQKAPETDDDDSVETP